MDYCITNLGSFIQQNAPSLEQRLEFCEQVLKGITHCQNERVIHGDMKLDNILVTQDHHLVLSDFGTAVLCNEEFTILCLDGMSLAGNQKHMAPEVRRFDRCFQCC